VTKGAWLAAGAAGLLVVAGVALFLVGDALTSDDNGDDGSSSATAGALTSAVEDATPASDPFSRLTETTISVGDETTRVVVADDSPERYRGLRGREDIGHYDGMLFVFDAPTSTAFTMSTVRTPLAIGFYGADGQLVDRLRMEPCRFAESRCPLYRAEGDFTYALETLPGDLPPGAISP
jgi:uncharacterized membrane protein (UPF0127 family)